VKLATVALLVVGCNGKAPPLDTWCHDFSEQLGTVVSHTAELANDNARLRDHEKRMLDELLGYAVLGLAGHVCGAAQGDSDDEQEYRSLRLSKAAYEASILLIAFDPVHGPIEAPQLAQLDGSLRELTTALAEKTRTRPAPVPAKP
jgi:hypothetical protein